MKRKASAVWSGDLKSGKGSLSTESGTLKQTQYSFSTRFENGVGTNPEELIAAAHAGCFSMAFSAELGKAGQSGVAMLDTWGSGNIADIHDLPEPQWAGVADIGFHLAVT